MLKPRLGTSERPATFREHMEALIWLLPFLLGLVLATIFGNIFGAVFWIVMTCVGTDRMVVNIGMRSIIFLILIIILFPIFSRARTTARATACLSNTKQVTWAALLYAQDYDGKFPGNDSPFANVISPYLKSRSLLTCPEDQPGTISYTFNSNLAALAPSKMAWPEKTILIYEGKAEKLNSRHDERASVGFVDGHCKLTASPDIASLFWTAQALPAPPPPSPTVAPANTPPTKDKGTAEEPEAGGPAYMR